MISKFVKRNVNPYQDKIMGGLEGDPLTNISNQFAISGPGMDQGFVNQYNLEQRFDPMFYSDDQPEIAGFNFKDAPIETSFFKRITNPAFKPYINNPRTGIIDNTILSKGNPGNTIIDRAKSGIGKGINLGKAAIGGIASLVTGIPGLGLLFDAFQETPEQKAMKEFYGSQFGLTDTGQIASGIMQGYNPAYGFGGAGLQGAIDKRIARIQKTLQKKKSETLQNRLKALQELKEKDRLAKLGANKGIGGLDPSGPTQKSIREGREDLSGRGQRGGFTNPGKGSYGPYS